MQQVNRQLKVSEQEVQRLKNRIEFDVLGARSNHDARIERFRRYYRMWRGLPTSPGNLNDGNTFEMPMLKWITFGHWSRVMSGLLGDDAEIIAKPVAPLDEAIVRKVGLYETWRWFEYMKATPVLASWSFRTILFGRAHVFCPYAREFFWERMKAKDVTNAMLKEWDEEGTRYEENKDGTVDVEKTSYDGPKLIPLWPSEIILPAQDGVQCVTDFAWKVRRSTVTPQDLLDGERRGIYQNIRSNWQQIYSFAQQRQERDYWLDDEKIDADLAEGVNHYNTTGNRDTLELWEWYGKWRLPKGKRDSRPENLQYRDEDETEMLVKYLKGPQLIVGIQDLRDLYPRMKKRDPFLDMGLVKDGSYWGPGMGEMVEDINRKGTANYALFERAGKLSVGPVIFYKPSAGNFDPETFVYEPGLAIPTEDPASVQIVNMKADLSFSEQNQQALSGFAEKVTGVSDQTLGQSIDRPNAPRTASGQMALIEQGNVRASLDMSMLRDDLSQAVEYTWALDREFAPDSVFFRVTEDDANGLFDSDNGFGTMTTEEREHGFDFQLKFATSIWSREAKKAEWLQLYQVAIQNPLVQQNPKALWALLNRLWKAIGEDDFASIIPPPPDMDLPLDPKTEWAMVLKREDVKVNPLDDDDVHIMDHTRRVEKDREQNPENQDPGAEKEMLAHIQDHEHQKRQKMILQALAQRIQQQIAAQQQGMQGAGAPAPPVAQNPPIGPQPDQGGAPQPASGPAAAAEMAGPAGVGAP